MKYYGKVKDPKEKWAKVKRKIDVMALEEECITLRAIAVGRSIDEIAEICSKSRKWVKDRLTLSGLWDAANHPSNFDGISLGSLLKKIDAIPMSFEDAVEHFLKEGNQQPSKELSQRNNRGWHLYNVNGYLGSINKHGEHFIVKSRMKGGE